jgi:hypothetical protein
MLYLVFRFLQGEFVTSNRRGKLLINAPFQLRVLLYVNVILFFCLLCYGALIMHVAGTLQEMQFITENQMLALNRGVLPLLILLQVVIHAAISIFVFFITFRIAGPIQRFKSVMNSFLKDNYFKEDFNIRKMDYFPEVKDILNLLNTKYRNQYIEHQLIKEELNTLLNEPIPQQLRLKIDRILNKSVDMDKIS